MAPPSNFSRAFSWISENPGRAALYGLAGVGTGVALAPGVVAAPALAAVGFGADGIAKLSMAAAIQSGIGNVAAGSAFATLQSAGMAGSGAAVVNGVVSFGGALVALASGSAASKAKPAQFNPTEVLWSVLKANIWKPEDLERLADAVEKSWARISFDMDTPTTTTSMQREFETATAAKGWDVKY